VLILALTAVLARWLSRTKPTPFGVLCIKAIERDKTYCQEISIGDITTGAENDLVEATRLARRMVTRWGMGSLDSMAFQADEEQPFLGYDLARGRDYSEATAAHIDQDVQHLLEERHKAVRRLLTDAREQLERLVRTLLQEETIDQDELARILGPRPEATVEVQYDAKA
jgi:cell division protease FtsH